MLFNNGYDTMDTSTTQLTVLHSTVIVVLILYGQFQIQPLLVKITLNITFADIVTGYCV